MPRLSLLLLVLALLSASCTRTVAKESATFPAGEKVTVGHLIFSVIDTQILTQLGDDPATARTPQNRFYVMTISVSNSSTDDLAIPGLTLVDDSGKEYPELADGTNVPRWLGIVRKVGGAQTEQGNIVFDAPAGHYRLRFTDETDEKQIYADIPLNFVHEQMKNVVDGPAQENAVELPNKQ